MTHKQKQATLDYALDSLGWVTDVLAKALDSFDAGDLVGARAAVDVCRSNTDKNLALLLSERAMQQETPTT